MAEDDGTNSRQRRKLTLLPEVLPDPLRATITTASAPNSQPSSCESAKLNAGEPTSARARTLDHMRRLIASATATVALVGCSSENPSAEPSKDNQTATSSTSGSKPSSSAAGIPAEPPPTTSPKKKP